MNDSMFALSSRTPQYGGTSSLMPQPQNYSLLDSMSSYGQAPSFDGVGGNGMRSNGFNPISSLGGFGGGGDDRGMFSSFLQQRNSDGSSSGGYGQVGLGIAQGALNAWMGIKQYGLAKKQLAAGKEQFALNYDAQRKTTNAQLEDRQRARVGSAPAGTYESVGDYMAKNGIKGQG